MLTKIHQVCRGKRVKNRRARFPEEATARTLGAGGRARKEQVWRRAWILRPSFPPTRHQVALRRTIRRKYTDLQCVK